MLENIKVSIIIPLYMVEDYMEKCVDSILGQSHTNLDIILVNDGSPDKSGDIANKYAKLDNRVRVVHKKNGGLSSARNEGLQKAFGEYVLFIDSDDWAHKDLVKKSLTMIEKTQSEICVFNVNRIREIDNQTEIQAEQIKEGSLDINDYGKENYINNYILNSKAHRYSAWNRLYKLAFLKVHSLEFKPNNKIHSEDMLFNLECALYANRICTVNEPLYYHLLRAGTISTSKKPNITFKLMSLADTYKSILINTEGNERKIKCILPKVVQYLFFMSMGSELNNNNVNFKELYKVVKSCYKFPFFKECMLIMGKQSLSKRNIISLLLGMNMAYISTAIIYKRLS